jgi:hypothetical protein
MKIDAYDGKFDFTAGKHLPEAGDHVVVFAC